VKVYIVRIEPLCRDDEPFVTEDDIAKAIQKLVDKHIRNTFQTYNGTPIYGDSETEVDVMQIN